MMDCRYEVGTLCCSGRWQAIMAVYVVQVLCKRANVQKMMEDWLGAEMNKRCAVLHLRIYR